MEAVKSPHLHWLNHLPIGAVVVDEKGVILGCNQRAHEILGAGESTPVGASLMRFFAEAERERLSRLITVRSATSGENVAEVFTRLGADESQRLVEVNTAPLPDVAAGSGAIVLLQDVTERINAAAEQQRLVKTLRQREELYQQAMSVIRAVPYLKDYATNSYLFMGRGILQMTGYSAEEMTPDLWDRITHDTIMRGEAEGLSVTEAMQKAFRGELRFWQSESQLTTWDGQTRWVADCSVGISDETGHSVGSVGVLTDITERKRAEETLDRRLMYLQALYRLMDALNRAETAEAIYEEALDTVQNALRVDRAAILLFDPDGVMRFKAWRGLADAYRRAVEGHLPWSPDEKNPQPVFIPDVAADTSLGALREVILGEGIRALGFIPLVSQGRLLGKFMLYCNAPRQCDAEFAQLAQTIAHHVAFAIERQRTMAALQYRLAFEQLISSLSNHFINLPPEEVDSGIQHALQVIGEFIGADRSYVFLFAEDGATMDNTHEWCAEGIEPQIDNLKGLRIEDFPWSMERIQRLETVGVPRVADLPPEASPEKAIFEAQDIQALVLVPLVWGQTAIGFVGFDAVRATRDWSEDSVTLLRVVGEMIANTLVRRRAEMRLRQAEEKYRSIFENAVEGIYQSTPDGRILTANPALARIWGYDSPEELVATLTDIERQLYVDPTQRDEFKRLMEDHGEIRGFEFQVRRKDGRLAWMSENARAVRDGSGALLYYEGTIEDITARKEAEEALHETNRRLEETLAELQAAQQQLLQQERLRALGTMASGIAHDFNNALAPILGFSELLLLDPQRLDERERVLEYLRAIHTAAQDAADVVSRLREFYRFRDITEQFPSVDLNQIVKQAILLTQPKWKDQAQASGITIRVQTDLQPIPLIPGSEAELREMLTNLIFNAVDAMPHGGTITVRTFVEEMKDVRLERSKEGDSIDPSFLTVSLASVVLEVIDTGVGMTEEVRRRCLEPFFSTKGERGSGLGLAVVYGIMQRHGGTIEIDSAPGQGTTVRLRLPMQTEPSHEDRAATGVEQPRPLHVLVVDDEPRVREVIVEYLRRDGHTVETAASGREALEKFRANKFDLLIADRAMPEMSGDQLALTLKQFDASTPVILLTGFGEFMNAAGERPAGVDIIVSKPIGLTALREAIAKVMRT